MTTSDGCFSNAECRLCHNLECYAISWLSRLTGLLVKVTLRPTASWPVYFGVRHPFKANEPIFISQTDASVLMWGALSEERTGLQCGPVIPPGTGLLFVGFYDLQNYGGCIRPASPHWLAASEYYYRRSVGQSACLGVRHPSGSCEQFIFFFFLIIIRQLRVCWYGAPTLMRGWGLPTQYF
jgi:hypothetical protein